MKDKIREAIRCKLEDMREFEYSDGCVLFWSSFCTKNEWDQISSGNGGMLDTLSRVITDVVMDNINENRN